MPQTRPNKAVVPINSDAYNLTTHLATFADSLTIPVKVASAAERDALPSPQNGDKVIRTDLPAQPFESYDSGTGLWITTRWVPSNVTITGFSIAGTVCIEQFDAGKLVNVNLCITRTAGTYSATGGVYTHLGGTPVSSLPAAALGTSPSGVLYLPGLVVGSGVNHKGQLAVNPSSGQVSFMPDSTFNFDNGKFIFVNVNYVLT